MNVYYIIHHHYTFHYTLYIIVIMHFRGHWPILQYRSPQRLLISTNVAIPRYWVAGSTHFFSCDVGLDPSLPPFQSGQLLFSFHRDDFEVKGSLFYTIFWFIFKLIIKIFVRIWRRNLKNLIQIFFSLNTTQFLCLWGSLLGLDIFLRF